MRTAIVLAGGDRVARPGEALAVAPGTLVVAADSGLHQASSLGLHVDVVVGDLDSADAALVAAAQAAGARIERHPRDKDATDLELALDCARREGATSIVVFGGTGGRLDHFLANVLLLAHPSLAGVAVVAVMDDARVRVVRGGEPPVALHGAAGSLVTLLPAGGHARGVVTDGLEYPLAGEDLGPGTTRGVSNVLVGTEARVSLTGGTLLVIQTEEVAGEGVS
jgi:thiamine pyrophosphokinase